MTFTTDPPLISDLSLIPGTDEKADLNAPAGSGGKLVIGQAPNITITETTVVADAAERLALDVQEGDVAIQTNVSTSFIFTGGDNVAPNWQAIDFDAVGAIAGEDIAPGDVNATGSMSMQDLTVAGAINGADTSAASAGEALTSDGAGGFGFTSVGGGQILQNGNSIEYVAATTADLPTPTGTGDVALVGGDRYVTDQSGVKVDINSIDTNTVENKITGSSRVDGIAFVPDGTRFVICSRGGNDVEQFDCSTPYDITTSSETDRFSVSEARDVRWNNDGTKLVVATDTTDILQYNLSTPYDIGTASQGATLTTSIGDHDGLEFNSNGTKMYTCSRNLDHVTETGLGSAFDPTTAGSFSTVSVNFGPAAMKWSIDGLRVIFADQDNDNIVQADAGSPFSIGSIDFNNLTTVNDLGNTGNNLNGIDYITSVGRLYTTSYLSSGGSNAEEIVQADISGGGNSWF